MLRQERSREEKVQISLFYQGSKEEQRMNLHHSVCVCGGKANQNISSEKCRDETFYPDHINT